MNPRTPRKERFTVKKTPKKQKTASSRRGRASLRLRGLWSRLSEKWKAGRAARRSFFRALWRAGWRCGVLLLLCAVLMLALVMTVSTSMVKLTAPQIVTADTLPATDYDCILVLGAGVRADGTPSDMLYDRVKVACGAYRAMEGVPILMSGDHTGDYNEVGAMKALAVELETYSADIFLDHEGYSTYESLYRAKAVFGAKKILIVTQEYHLHRALYIARELGLEAEGISADLRPYRGQSRYNAREHLARFKDFFAAARGTYNGHLGPPVDLDGNGDLT